MVHIEFISGTRPFPWVIDKKRNIFIFIRLDSEHGIKRNISLLFRSVTELKHQIYRHRNLSKHTKTDPCFSIHLPQTVDAIIDFLNTLYPEILIPTELHITYFLSHADEIIRIRMLETPLAIVFQQNLVQVFLANNVSKLFHENKSLVIAGQSITRIRTEIISVGTHGFLKAAFCQVKIIVVFLFKGLFGGSIVIQKSPVSCSCILSEAFIHPWIFKFISTHHSLVPAVHPFVHPATGIF